MRPDRVRRQTVSYEGLRPIYPDLRKAIKRGALLPNALVDLGTTEVPDRDHWGNCGRDDTSEQRQASEQRLASEQTDLHSPMGRAAETALQDRGDRTRIGQRQLGHGVGGLDGILLDGWDDPHLGPDVPSRGEGGDGGHSCHGRESDHARSHPAGKAPGPEAGCGQGPRRVAGSTGALLHGRSASPRTRLPAPGTQRGPLPHPERAVRSSGAADPQRAVCRTTCRR
jgi:hypothetical protein